MSEEGRDVSTPRRDDEMSDSGALKKGEGRGVCLLNSGGRREGGGKPSFPHSERL